MWYFWKFRVYNDPGHVDIEIGSENGDVLDAEVYLEVVKMSPLELVDFLGVRPGKPDEDWNEVDYKIGLVQNGVIYHECLVSSPMDDQWSAAATGKTAIEALCNALAWALENN